MSIPELSPATVQIVKQYPVRKTKAQKLAFREEITTMLEQQAWPVTVHSAGQFVKSNNLVVGNPATAKVLFTAHYDTPARLPFPNIILPNNMAVTLLTQLVMALLILFPSFFVMGVVRFYTNSFIMSYFAFMLFLSVIIYFLVSGPANPSNANDNTSGVAVLLESALALPQELQSQVAFIFFDNEEKGLLGSNAFAAKHPALKDVPVLNFDCVGEGDTLSFFPSKKCRKDAAILKALQEAFLSSPNKSIEIFTSPFSFYPSDQIAFRKGIGIAALQKHSFFGYYLNKIHTPKDTVLDAENIQLFQQGCCRFAQCLCELQTIST